MGGYWQPVSPGASEIELVWTGIGRAPTRFIGNQTPADTCRGEGTRTVAHERNEQGDVIHADDAAGIDKSTATSGWIKLLAGIGLILVFALVVLPALGKLGPAREATCASQETKDGRTSSSDGECAVSDQVGQSKAGRSEAAT